MKSFRKRILVTGGAGFIGSHLCEDLLGKGHEVFCVDNLSTGQLANIVHLQESDLFKFHCHDICHPLSLVVDEIYNLACPASPVNYQNDPIKTIQTNVVGTINMLDLARSTGAVLLQASTSEVYGDPLLHPQAESYRGNVNPIGPRSCYDEGKRCAETICFDYHRQGGVRIKVARIFNTYGPRLYVADGRVISNFIVKALRGEAITIHGSGRQTRSFCYVEDLIRALQYLMATSDEITGPVNLGNPEEISISDLAQRIINLLGSKSLLTFRPLPEDDPLRRQPDITLARELLDWEPYIPLDEGLRKTIQYFQEILSLNCKTKERSVPGSIFA